MNIFKKIQNRYYYNKLGKAIDRAEDLRAQTGYKYFVINIGGIKVVPKKVLKEMIARKMITGVTIAELEQKALYKTR